MVGGGVLSVDAEARLQGAVSRAGASADLLALALALVGVVAAAVLVHRWRHDSSTARPGEERPAVPRARN